MRTDEEAKNSSKITINLFGIGLVIAPQSKFEWAVVLSILVSIGFLLFLFLDNAQLRRTIAAWIDPGAVSNSQFQLPTSAQPPQAGSQPGATDGRTAERSPPKPPIATPGPGKTDPEGTIEETPGQTTTSGPGLAAPKVYRVRSTTPNLRQPYNYLPLRSMPGTDGKTERARIPPGTKGLIGTGERTEIYEGVFDKILGTPPVPWIEVRYKDKTGWVSGPYIEEVPPQ
jgi:hypothetical protein